MKKRILSLMLVLAMVLSLLPMSAFAAQEYGVWVNGERFTDSKLTIQCGDGKATYDPAKAELTLENAAITKTNSNTFPAGINALSDISIIVKGSNTIQSAREGIRGQNDIVISGDGELRIESQDPGIICRNVTVSANHLLNIASDSAGIMTQQNVTIHNGYVHIETKSDGIYSGQSTTISGDSSVYIISEDGDGISSLEPMSVSDKSEVMIVAHDDGISCRDNFTYSSEGDMTIIATSGIYSYTEVTLSGGGNVVIISGDCGIGGGANGTTISGSGNVTVASQGTGAYVHGDLILSGSGNVDIYGKEIGVKLNDSDGKVLLNGTHDSIAFSADSGNKAVNNIKTNGSPVAGTNFGKYSVTGDPASESVVYTLNAPVMPFVDVKEGDFFYDPVLWAVKNNITNGVDATHFGPGNDCLRAQVVTFLWRAAGQPEPTTTNNPFVDVKESDFYYKPVLWAVENKITSGMDATHFGPMEKCNRAQVVTFLYRAAGSPAVSASNPFVDVPAGSFYEAPVLWAVEKGITNGMDAIHFGPGSTCNRAQIVTFLYRCYGQRVSDLSIRLQPHNAAAPVGTNAVFTVAPQGGEQPYTYQWQYRYLTDGQYTDWADLNLDWANGTKTNRLTVQVSSADFEFQYQYRCIITDATKTSVISDAVGVLAESTAPLYTTVDPEDQYAQVGSTAVLTVAAAGGTPPYQYQWQYIYDELGGWTEVGTGWSTGGKTTTLSFKVTQSDITQHFRYRCVITDALGNGVVSLPAAIYSYKPLKITTHPKDLMVSVGSPIALSVQAQYGQPAYSYRWQYRYKTGTDSYCEWQYVTGSWAEGADTNTISFRVDQKDHTYWYQYRCEVTDQAGDVVYSRPGAMVPPGTALMIKTQPESAEAHLGEWVRFHAEAIGGKAPYKFNWQFRSTEFDWVTMNDPSWNGKETDTLAIPVRERDFKYCYEYRCMITDANGKKVYTDPVGVLPRLRITGQPEDSYTGVGGLAVFEVWVSDGVVPCTYQWQICRKLVDGSLTDWSDVSDSWATGGQTYRLEFNVGEDEFAWIYYYRCVITDAWGYQAISSSVRVINPA